MKRICEDTKMYLCFRRLNVFYAFLIIVILDAVIGGMLIIINTNNKIFSGLPYLSYIVIFSTLIQAFEMYYFKGDQDKLKLIILIYGFIFLLHLLGLVYYILDIDNDTGIAIMCFTIIINVLGLINHIFGVFLLYSYYNDINHNKTNSTNSILI